MTEEDLARLRDIAMGRSVVPPSVALELSRLRGVSIGWTLVPRSEEELQSLVRRASAFGASIVDGVARGLRSDQRWSRRPSRRDKRRARKRRARMRG